MKRIDILVWEAYRVYGCAAVLLCHFVFLGNPRIIGLVGLHILASVLRFILVSQLRHRECYTYLFRYSDLGQSGC